MSPRLSCFTALQPSHPGFQLLSFQGKGWKGGCSLPGVSPSPLGSEGFTDTITHQHPGAAVVENAEFFRVGRADPEDAEVAERPAPSSSPCGKTRLSDDCRHWDEVQGEQVLFLNFILFFPLEMQPLTAMLSQLK